MEKCVTQPDEMLDELFEEINREGNMTVSVTHGRVRRTLYIDDYVARAFSYTIFSAACDQSVTDGHFQKFKSLKACEKSG